jgi:hypothetical protein
MTELNNCVAIIRSCKQNRKSAKEYYTDFISDASLAEAETDLAASANVW